MKKLIMLFAFATVLTTQNLNAQVNLNFNVDTQPLWGPVGYDRADYYYLPEIESYYSVPKRQFIYQGNNGWIYANNLPSRYSGYDLYSGYKVVLNTPKPYLNFSNDRVKYAKFKGIKNQPVIKYSKDPKYKTIHANVNGYPRDRRKKSLVTAINR